MENPDSEDQGGHTPPITAEFIGNSLSQIMSTLKNLTGWKNQQTLQVVYDYNFQKNIAIILLFQWSFLKLFI